MAKYGLSPLPSHTQPPTGASASVNTRTTAGSVRRDGVTTTPTWSRRAIAASSAASRPPTDASSWIPAVAAAYQHRDQRPAERRETRPPRLRRRGQPFRRDPVQRGAGHHHVRPGQLIVPVDHDQVEEPRVHARMLHLHQPCHVAAEGRSHGGGRSAAADHQVRQWGTHRIADCRQRTWPELRRDVFPRRARLQHAHFGGKPGGLGEAERLGLQSGELFAKNPWRGALHHAPAFRRAAAMRQCASRVRNDARPSARRTGVPGSNATGPTLSLPGCWRNIQRRGWWAFARHDAVCSTDGHCPMRTCG